MPYDRPRVAAWWPLSFLLLVLASSSACRGPAAPPPAPTDQDQRMAWWRDARFGMFLHWGLYALPAGSWSKGPRAGDDHGEWIRTTAQIPRDEYASLQARWNPVEFDADAWARTAKQAGMKYVVITSKHHDGFCLWDSDVTDWDVGATRQGRDILQELSDACRRHGLKFCTYHSIMDWHHPDYLPRRGWETDRATEGADFDRFERYLHAQVTELIERYRPAVMWFDGEWEKTWTHARGVRLFELCRRLAPEMIVNNRVDVHRQGMQGFSAAEEAVGDFDTPEQEIPSTGLPGVDWESCMTMNRHWGWNAADRDWKSTATLLHNLIDIASKGGNYLLNVGPRADGTFPPEASSRLAALGAWMRVNGEAIHGTTASVFPELPWGRVTVRAGAPTSKLYLHVFDGSRRLVLPGLANRVRSATLLARPEQHVDVRSVGALGGVRITLPAELPDPIATVVVLELEGAPLVYQSPEIRAPRTKFVQHVDVTIENRSQAGVVRYTIDGSVPDIRSPAAGGAIRIDDATVLRAALFADGLRRSAITEQRFERLELLPARTVEATGPGLQLQRIDADWQRIPTSRAAFDAAVATTAAHARVPDGSSEHTAVRLLGYIEAPRDGLWRLCLTSDDGSRLWLDDRLVVDHDGLHDRTAKTDAVALSAGLHRFELVWFNCTGSAALQLEWAHEDSPFTEVPASAYRH